MLFRSLTCLILPENVAIFFSLSQKSQINLSSSLVARYPFMTDGIAKVIVIVEFSLMRHVFRD